MANLISNRAALLVLVHSIFLIITIAESRPVFHAATKAKAALACDTVFGVRKGDTCFDIAHNFKLSTSDFDSINPNINCAALFVGQWVCVDHVAAKTKAAPACDTVFGVTKGDTCFDIAKNFKLSTSEFDSINPNINCAALFVGQWVCVDGTA